MGMNPMGGDASSMPPAPGDDPMMGGDPNTMGGPSMMGGDPNAISDPNTPVMGANPFDDDEGSADVSGDPEKKAESLAGQLASIFRKDLKNDGINTHIDKKKEVLGMIASAVVDGMNDEDRNSMIEYLSDKLNGSGESDGDTDNGSQDMDGENQDMNREDQNAIPPDGSDPMMGGGLNAMGGDPSQQMIESKVNEVVNEIIGDLMKKKPKPAAKVDQEEKQGYKGKPYQAKK
ncbi:MAG: hypothetical protein II670_08600 [Alphaproteobacteria bacterium]|nr:hypothetical protein [Alphaproteobacteria bacterium]